MTWRKRVARAEIAAPPSNFNEIFFKSTEIHEKCFLLIISGI